MITREIEPARWSEFLDLFSRKHEGNVVTVEYLNDALGAQIEYDDGPLTGVSAEKRGNRQTVSIFVGFHNWDHLGHVITEPQSLYLEKSDHGSDEVLAITSRDGSRTLIRLRDEVRIMLDPLIE